VRLTHISACGGALLKKARKQKPQAEQAEQADRGMSNDETFSINSFLTPEYQFDYVSVQTSKDSQQNVQEPSVGAGDKQPLYELQLDQEEPEAVGLNEEMEQRGFNGINEFCGFTALPSVPIVVSGQQNASPSEFVPPSEQSVSSEASEPAPRRVVCAAGQQPIALPDEANGFVTNGCTNKEWSAMRLRPGQVADGVFTSYEYLETSFKTVYLDESIVRGARKAKDKKQREERDAPTDAFKYEYRKCPLCEDYFLPVSRNEWLHSLTCFHARHEAAFALDANGLLYKYELKKKKAYLCSSALEVHKVVYADMQPKPNANTNAKLKRANDSNRSTKRVKRDNDNDIAIPLPTLVEDLEHPFCPLMPFVFCEAQYQ
jgi:hypothetical protein